MIEMCIIITNMTFWNLFRHFHIICAMYRTCGNLLFLRLVLRSACPYFSNREKFSLKLEVYPGVQGRLSFPLHTCTTLLMHFRKVMHVLMATGSMFVKRRFSGVSMAPALLRQSHACFDGHRVYVCKTTIFRRFHGTRATKTIP